MKDNFSGESAADILVIGGGGAALTAACRCRELGASVTLLSKKRPGLASCTAYAGGGFTAPLEGVSGGEYQEMVLRAGRGLNDAQLVRVLAEDAGSAFDRVQDWGVQFNRRPGSASVRGELDNPLLRGTGLTFPLLRRARELGVNIVYPFSVTRLLQEDFRAPVRGVAGVDGDGQVRRIRGRSVILASGGAGYLYGRTDNPAGITGDGYAMALAAGASLRDMEFVQFYPLGSVHEGANWFMDTQLLDSVRLSDGNGEEFLSDLLREWNLSSGAEINLLARDRMSAAIEAKRRSTGRVTLHLEEAGSDLRSNDEIAHLAALMSRDRSDPWRPVEVAPVQHFFCGGVVTDEWGATGVGNLLACGEVAGGAHGANRVGGNALTELLVFSLRAAGAAVQNAGRTGGGTLPGRSEAFSPRGVQIRSIDGEEPSAPAPPEWEYSFSGLRRLIMRHLGPVREAGGLKDCLQTSLYFSREGLSDGKKMPAVTAQLIAASALARRESRGCHRREDYPGQEKELRVCFAQPVQARDGMVEVNINRQRAGG